MQVTKITARRTVHKSIGQYEYDQRVFEYEALLSQGESVEVATLALNALLAGCFNKSVARDVAQTIANSPASQAADAPIVMSEQEVRDTLDAAVAKISSGLAEPVQRCDDALDPCAAMAEVVSPEPAQQPVMDFATFSAAVATRAKVVGAARVLELREKYGVKLIKEIADQDRAAFLAALS